MSSYKTFLHLLFSTTGPYSPAFPVLIYLNSFWISSSIIWTGFRQITFSCLNLAHNTPTIYKYLGTCISVHWCNECHSLIEKLWKCLQITSSCNPMAKWRDGELASKYTHKPVTCQLKMVSQVSSQNYAFQPLPLTCFPTQCLLSKEENLIEERVWTPPK